MEVTRNAKHEELRRQLESDVAAFLQEGHVIEEVDYTANKGWRDRHKKRQQHVPIIITPRQNARNHPWSNDSNLRA